MRGEIIPVVAGLVAATLFGGCGGADPLNAELDVSGSYSLVLADADPAALVDRAVDLSGEYTHVFDFGDGVTDTYPVELEKNKGGWYDVTWRWTDDSGVEQLLTGVGVAFGGGYFAVAEPGDDTPLYLFGVGEGALGGRLFLSGDPASTPTTVAAEGKRAPEPPEVTPLEAGLSLNVLGTTGDGSPYLGYYDFQPNGESVSVAQLINPGSEDEEEFYGVAALVEDYLVVNVSGLLTVFRRAGEDWTGLWVDLEAGALGSEILTPDDAKLDVMTYFVGNDFELSRRDDGFFIARWEMEGEPFEAPALTFGEGYLALGIPDPEEPWLGVFTVGDGAMGGRWITWGSTTVLDVDVVSDGAEAPDPPELERLPREGTFNCSGTNPQDEPYEGVYTLESKGDIVACRQTVTPTEGEVEVYEGVGAVVDGYLVLATGPFLTVYSPSGDDWEGVWTDPYDKQLNEESLDFFE